MASTSIHGDSNPGADGWPGRELGLPASGPRSVGRIGRRLVALIIDWGIAVAISAVLFGYDPLGNLGTFALMQVASIATFAGSIGHLCVGLRVVPLSGGWIGVLRPVLRSLLLCLVIPAVIFDNDQRGFHDRLSGTILARS